MLKSVQTWLVGAPLSQLRCAFDVAILSLSGPRYFMQVCTSPAPDLGLLYLQEACVQFISSRLLAVPGTLDSVTPQPPS